MDELTIQEQNFVKEVVKTGNKTQAVVKAYKEKDLNYAHVKGSRLIRKDTIKKQVDIAKKTLAESIPDELVTARHIALLNKTEKKYNTDGDLISEEIDTQAVKAGVEMAYKLKGSYETDEQKNINVIIPVLVRFLHEKDERGNNGNTE